MSKRQSTFKGNFSILSVKAYEKYCGFHRNVDGILNEIKSVNAFSVSEIISFFIHPSNNPSIHHFHSEGVFANQ